MEHQTFACSNLEAVREQLADAGRGGGAIATLTGWWWVQYAAALALLWWLAPATREAIAAAREGRTYCECD